MIRLQGFFSFSCCRTSSTWRCLLLSGSSSAPRRWLGCVLYWEPELPTSSDRLPPLSPPSDTAPPAKTYTCQTDMSAYCTVQQWRDVLWSTAHPAVSQIGHVHHVIHHQHAGGCGSVLPRWFPVPKRKETEKEPEATTSPVQSMHLKNHKRFLFRSSYWLEAFFRKSSSVCLNVSRRHFLISLSKFSVSPGSKHCDSPIRKAVTAHRSCSCSSSMTLSWETTAEREHLNTPQQSPFPFTLHEEFIFKRPILYSFSDHYISSWTLVEQSLMNNYPKNSLDIQKTTYLTLCL